MGSTSAITGSASTSAGSVSAITGIGSTIAQTVSAYSQSRANQASAELQASVNRTNATISENQAVDAINRGNEKAIKNRMATANLAAKQRAMFAANGVVASEGSAASILSDTETLGAYDEATITQNAQREAFGYRTQADNYRGDADILKNKANSETPWISGASALLTSGTQVASNWYKWKKER